MKNSRSKTFLNYTDWAEENLLQYRKISYKLAKQKHREIIGEICNSRSWNKFSNRVMKRVNAEYLFDKEQPKGDMRHYWVSKE